MPEQFPSAQLDGISLRKVEAFFERCVMQRFGEYGYGHFVLACYAALPAVLSSDLLHKIWLNFPRYSWNGKESPIHPVAPADILLSPLVDEIGFELYEMPLPIRHALLVFIQNQFKIGNTAFGFAPVEKIAELLRDYARFDFTPDNPDDNAYREAQEWTALSYLEPGTAFKKLTDGYSAAETSQQKARYLTAMERMSARFSLEIVKDPAAIPNGHNAISAMTDIARDLLLHRNPSRLEEFKKSVDPTQLTDQPLLGDGMISIPIPRQVSERVTEKNTKMRSQGKTYALVIGTISNDPSNKLLHTCRNNDAALFSSLLKQVIPANDLKMKVLRDILATKANIKKAIDEIAEQSTDQDEIILYCSATGRQMAQHTQLSCFSNREEEQEIWLQDDELGDWLKKIKRQRCMLILETDYVAPRYWLDIKEGSNNIVLSACTFEQQSLNVQIWDQIQNIRKVPSKKAPPSTAVDSKQTSLFTAALVEVATKAKGYVSLRDWFIKTLERYESIIAKSGVGDDFGRNTYRPQIIGHPDVLDTIITTVRHPLARLQTLLRQGGFCDGATTGEWSNVTASSLKKYRELYNLPLETSKLTYIQRLESDALQKMASPQIPVFVLLFSNQKGQYKMMESEQKQIEALLDPYKDRFEIVTINNPSDKAISAVLSDRKYRNRIQLVYYSGEDEGGDFYLKSGRMTVFQLAELLQYQEKIHLWVANTCRSAVPCGWLSQLGVKIAIGAISNIQDDFASDFGVKLFRTVIEEGSLEKLDLTNVSPSQKTR